MLNITFTCDLYSLLYFLYNLKTKQTIHWSDIYPSPFHSPSILSSMSTYPFILQANLSYLIKTEKNYAQVFYPKITKLTHLLGNILAIPLI